MTTFEAKEERSIPSLVEGVDLRSLPISPEEAFVISRIDGLTGEPDLSAVTGLSDARVQEILERLLELGAIRYPAPATQRTPTRPPFRPPSHDQVSPPSPEPHVAASHSRTIARAPSGPSPTKVSAPVIAGAAAAVAAQVEPTVAAEAKTNGSPEAVQAEAVQAEAVQAKAPPRGAHTKAAPTEPTDAKPPTSPDAKTLPLEPAGAQPPTPAEAALPQDRTFLDEPVDIDLERRQKILDAFYRLDHATHYEILGVTRQSDRKEIKAAYFDAVNLFHPDRYYGKNLGSFKPRLEKIFAAITEAHDVLTRSSSKQEYDDYLLSQEKTRELDQFISDSQRAEQLAEPLDELDAASARDGESVGDSTDAPTAPSPAGAEVRKADPDAARRALMRKLFSASGPMPRRSLRPGITDAQRRDHALKLLRERRDAIINKGRSQQIEHYQKIAAEALAANKAVSAANALRLALNLSGNDPDIAKQLEDAEQKAHAEVADNYLAQATYEERTGRYADALRSYEKAARGKPGAKVFEKVALMALKTDGEAHTAVDYARKAARAAPEVPRYRQTLIMAYMAAGLKNSAVAEIERLEALAPDDHEIRGWLKRAKHGEL